MNTDCHNPDREMQYSGMSTESLETLTYTVIFGG